MDEKSGGDGTVEGVGAELDARLVGALALQPLVQHLCVEHLRLGALGAHLDVGVRRKLKLHVHRVALAGTPLSHRWLRLLPVVRLPHHVAAWGWSRRPRRPPARGWRH